MNIHVNSRDEITPVLVELESRASNLRDPAEEAGRIAVDSVHAAIDTEGRGTWDPAIVPTGHPLLFDTGALYQAVDYTVRSDGVEISDAMSYAGYQNDMREFMLLDDGASDEIEDVLAKHFSDI